MFIGVMAEYSVAVGTAVRRDGKVTRRRAVATGGGWIRARPPAPTTRHLTRSPARGIMHLSPAPSGHGRGGAKQTVRGWLPR